MYFKQDNECSLDTAKKQLDWFEESVTQIEGKIVLSLHVFPGLNNFMGFDEIFWHPEFTERFTKILYNHQSKIILTTGAHIHRAEFRDSISTDLPDISIPFLISPSISPVY